MPLERSCRAVMHVPWFRAAVLAGCAVAVFGCEGLLEPEAAPRVYVLASVAGVRLDSSVNLYDICAPEIAADGGEMYMLADSLLLYANGSGEESNLFRFREPLATRDTPDEPAFLSPRRIDFTYEIMPLNREITTRYEGDYPNGSYRIASDGALEGAGMCGTWRFERALARLNSRGHG